MDSLLRHLLDGVGLDEAATVNEIDAALPWSHVKSNSASPLLLFHRLLELAGIDPALYPPRDYPALRSLLQAILDSESFDGLKKSSLVYYLLKDYKDGREVAFAKTKRIPKRFQTIQDAYWYFDNEQYEEAIKKLCSPGLVPDFVPQILQLLADLPHSRSSPLLLNLTTYLDPSCLSNLVQSDIEIIVRACLFTNRPAEALAWMRRIVAEHEATFSQETEEIRTQKREEKRRELVKMMMEFCFTGNQDGSPLSKTLETLLYLPFNVPGDAAVLSWLQSTTSSSSSNRLSEQSRTIVNEWATSRLVAQGRYVEAITLLSASMSSLTTGSEAFVKADRSKKEMEEALPPVVKAQVEVALASSNKATSSLGKETADSQADKVSGNIAQLPWLPSLPLPHLPAPQSLSQASSNAATLQIARAGGPALSLSRDLPISAAGLGSSSSSTSAAGVKQLGQVPSANIAVGRNAERDERIELLRRVERSTASGSGSPARIPVLQQHDGGHEGMAGSPFGNSRQGENGTPRKQLAQYQQHQQQQQAGRERRGESPFSMASSYGGSQAQRPTVQGFGLIRPAQSGRSQNSQGLDFSSQLRSRDENVHATADSGIATSTPAKQARSMAPREEAGNAAQAGPSRSNNHNNNASASQPPRVVLPGSFGPNSDEDDEDDESHEPNHASDSSTLLAPMSAPPARSTRAASAARRRESSLQPVAEDEVVQSRPKRNETGNSRTRTRTKSQNRDTSNPAPSKRGRKNASTRSTSQQPAGNGEGQESEEEQEESMVQPTPRRSRRLGSAAPSEAGDETMALDDTFVGKKAAKTPRRRKP